MTIKRTFAGLIAALLLFASSLALACDVSCGFAQLQSDCHSAQAGNQDSLAETDMEMEGMAMPTMANANSAVQQIVIAPSQSEMGHALIGEMARCERESCDQVGSDISKSTQLITPQFQTVLAIVHSLHSEKPQIFFFNAQEGIPTFDPDHRVPLSISLRI